MTPFLSSCYVLLYYIFVWLSSAGCVSGIPENVILGTAGDAIQICNSKSDKFYAKLLTDSVKYGTIKVAYFCYENDFKEEENTMRLFKRLAAGASALALAATMAASGLATALPVSAVDDCNDDWLHAVGSKLDMILEADFI